MTDTLDGGCACSRLRYRMQGTPMFVHRCHCKDCQRQTGTGFVLNALIEADRVATLSGDLRPSAMPTDSGQPHHVFRCPDCGTAGVEPLRRPDQAALRPRRHARRSGGTAAGRAHIHAVEAAVDRAAPGGAGVRGVLQFARTMAGGQPGTAQGCAWVVASNHSRHLRVAYSRLGRLPSPDRSVERSVRSGIYCLSCALHARGFGRRPHRAAWLDGFGYWITLEPEAPGAGRPYQSSITSSDCGKLLVSQASWPPRYQYTSV
jgi:hypothetical protein